jgi:hypothetical protein
MALTEVRKDSRGNTIFVEENEVGGHRYWSDSIGNGVVIWDTALVSEEELFIAIHAERTRAAVALLQNDRNSEGS